MYCVGCVHVGWRLVCLFLKLDTSFGCRSASSMKVVHLKVWMEQGSHLSWCKNYCNARLASSQAGMREDGARIFKFFLSCVVNHVGMVIST